MIRHCHNLFAIQELKYRLFLAGRYIYVDLFYEFVVILSNIIDPITSHIISVSSSSLISNSEENDEKFANFGSDL